MSDSREPSYYEIALTNRQVLTVFVILLVCVVAAFLSGVWVGRKGGMAPVQVATAQTINAGVTPSEGPLDELNFFSEDGEKEEREAEPESGQPTGAESAFLPAEVEGDEPPPTAADPEAPAEPATEEPPVPAQPTQAEPARTGDLVVQVLSTPDRQRAESILARLRSGGYPAQLSEVQRQDQTMYRVRVGPYVDRDEAQAVADKVRGEYRLDTWITQ